MCVFHNLKAYDSNFTLKKFDKKYAQYKTKRDTTTNRDIKAIPINSEKTLQFQIRNVIYSDSCEFLSASLDTLVSTLKKDGRLRGTRSGGCRVYHKPVQAIQPRVIVIIIISGQRTLTNGRFADSSALPPANEFV